jgi:hypothetical protein
MAPAAAAVRHQPPRHHLRIEYDISLGDSLSVGVQPNASGQSVPTSQGYDNDLYHLLRARDLLHGIDLRLVELGCPGETTGTMINGGICAYTGATSQLDAATAFLKAHRGQVALVTLDIGNNNVDHCVAASGIDLGCVEQGIAADATDLPTITAALRKADPDRTTRWAGLNAYDPYLASWLTGTAGQALASASSQLQQQFNAIPQQVYSQAGFSLVDIANAFHSYDTTTVPLPGYGSVPLNVASICELTWMCAPAPQGPNIHATSLGYAVMAKAILAKL